MIGLQSSHKVEFKSSVVEKEVNKLMFYYSIKNHARSRQINRGVERGGSKGSDEPPFQIRI